MTNTYKRLKPFLFFFLLFPSIYFLFLLFGIKANFIYFSQSDSLFKGFAIKTINQNIRENDLVLFKSPNKEITIHNVDFLIKKVKYIEDGRLFVVGKTEEELYEEYKIEGLLSYDSNFFGLIKSEDCIKVRELKATNYILRLIKAI